MMLRRFQFLAGFALFLALLAACSSDPTPTPPPSQPTPTPTPSATELRMISAWADGIALADVGDVAVMKAIGDTSNGRLRVVRAGGPESVPTFQQLVPTRDGLFDMNSTTIAYHPDFTSIGGGWNAVKGSLDSRVACGMFQVMDDFYANEVGVKFLGQLTYRVGSRTYSNQPIDPATASLEGLKLRAAGPTASAFVERLGGTTVSMPIGELYEGLDRGLVDGATVGGGAQLAVQFGWHENLKYVVKQSVAYTSGMYLMNMDTWNGLSADLQQAVIEGIALATYRSAEEFYRLDQEAIQTMVDSGMELITLTPEAAQRVDDIYAQAQFEVLEANEPAAYVQRMRETADCVKNATG